MLASIWDECINHLQRELPEQQFNTWIRPLQFNDTDTSASTLTLIAPNRFVLDWVNDKFRSRIEDLAKQLSSEGGPLQVEIVAASRTPAFAAPLNGGVNEADKTLGLATNGASAHLASAAAIQPIHNSLNYGGASEFDGLNSDRASYSTPKASVSNNVIAIETPQVQRVSKADVEGGILHKTNLNEDFVFNNFVEGKSNQLALAAATQVAENPGGAYNPLFIYGGVGLGKTHLMHAVGNALNRRAVGAKVVYLHSERFVADMVKALQLNAINDFKRYYRSVDALLIDDIQFFAGKERSQEEFFHTFNALLEGGQQIIVTCDRYPKEINGLEERLKSRFGWGLTVAIEPPELETRVAILMRKAEQANMDLPHDAAFFIAQRIRSNVRELEGALKRVIANAQFTNRPITVELVREALKDLLALQDRLVSIDNIQRVVAEYYKIKVSDLHSKRRSRSVARPRQVAMYLAKELTNHSLPEIGDTFGGRDHTTVLHACRKIKELIGTDGDINEDVKNLLRTLTT